MLGQSSDAIQKKAARLARTRDALVDARRGRLIDGELILEWVASWGTENEKPVSQTRSVIPTSDDTSSWFLFKYGFDKFFSVSPVQRAVHMNFLRTFSIVSGFMIRPNGVEIATG